MTNQYDAPEVMEIGKASEVILGSKIDDLGPDSFNPLDPRAYVE
jgi:hypothetical protein